MSKKHNENDLNKHRLHEETNSSDGTYDLGKDAPAPDNVQKLKPDDLGSEHWRGEAEKFKNEYLYLMAEFENYKKNVIKERSDMRKYGSERLIVEILNGLDLLDKALETKVSSENVDSFRKGIKSMLQKFGVEELPAKGAAFDPNMHEALSSEETRDVPAGHISQVYRKPYKLHERVVRPGQVVVAREPSEKKSE